MEVTGVCSICGHAEKLHTCVLCGNLVCSHCITGQGTCIRHSHGRSFSERRKSVV